MSEPIEGNPAVDAEIKEQLAEERGEVEESDDFSDNSGVEGHDDR